MNRSSVHPKNAGFSTAVILIAVALVSAGGAGYYYYSTELEESQPVVVVDTSDATQQIKEQIAEVIEGVSEDSVSIIDQIGSYAKVAIKNSDEEGKDDVIYTIYSGGSWKVIEPVDEVYSCERLDKFGFPGNLIKDCALANPEMVDISTLSDSIGEEVVIAGLVTISDEPNCSTCFTVSTSDGDVVVEGGSEADVEDGDVVVVTGTVVEGTPNDDSSNEEEVDEQEESNDEEESDTEEQENDEEETVYIEDPEVEDVGLPDDDDLIDAVEDPENSVDEDEIEEQEQQDEEEEEQTEEPQEDDDDPVIVGDDIEDIIDEEEEEAEDESSDEEQQEEGDQEDEEDDQAEEDEEEEEDTQEEDEEDGDAPTDIDRYFNFFDIDNSEEELIIIGDPSN